MKITEDQVAHVAHLARLAIREDERDMFTSQLNDILMYIDILNGADTSGVEPMSHASGGADAFREDMVQVSLGVDSSLANAPDHNGASFKVPKIIE